MKRKSSSPKTIYKRRVGRIGSSTNHSHYITLPVEIIRDLGLKVGDEVTIKRVAQKIHIAKSLVKSDDPLKNNFDFLSS